MTVFLKLEKRGQICYELKMSFAITNHNFEAKKLQSKKQFT